MTINLNNSSQYRTNFYNIVSSFNRKFQGPKINSSNFIEKFGKIMNYL